MYVFGYVLNRNNMKRIIVSEELVPLGRKLDIRKKDFKQEVSRETFKVRGFLKLIARHDSFCHVRKLNKMN